MRKSIKIISFMDKTKKLFFPDIGNEQLFGFIHAVDAQAGRSMDILPIGN